MKSHIIDFLSGKDVKRYDAKIDMMSQQRDPYGNLLEETEVKKEKITLYDLNLKKDKIFLEDSKIFNRINRKRFFLLDIYIYLLKKQKEKFSSKLMEKKRKIFIKVVIVKLYIMLY